jgi:hypothetical protein
MKTNIDWRTHEAPPAAYRNPYGSQRTRGASDSPSAVLTRPLSRLVVHEWGTFTSVAGEDGQAVEWCPLNGPVDLPGFVHRLRFNVKGAWRPGSAWKRLCCISTRHRRPVDVSVKFRQGVVTEWFASGGHAGKRGRFYAPAAGSFGQHRVEG